MASTRKKPSETTAGAGSGGNDGAKVDSVYHSAARDVVGVDVMDLKDFKSSSAEEFGQFAIGQFFASGGFWLGAQQVATVPIFYKDILFWFCAFSCVAGAIVAYFGYRQLKRRKDRLQHYIDQAPQQ